METEKVFPCIEVNQHGMKFYLANLPASIVTEISYASVRGRDDEQGSVQRVLNSRRIGNIKDFALNNGAFPNSIVMNWVKGNIVVNKAGNKIKFSIEEYSAQLIDGQHRVAGIKEAISEDVNFSDYELPVAIYINLSTKQCADIFLSINTEQKPVHRSLVFDLYEIADDQIVDQAAARARDIALELSDASDVPFYGMIKFPGEQPRKGGVALSTVVSSIKPLIEKNGIFDQVGLVTFENQSKVFLNYFNVMKKRYGEVWFERQNAFMYASGFSGAIEFLAARIVPFCVNNKSFSLKTISRSLDLNQSNLIYQKEVSGKSGTEARKYIFSRLDELFIGADTADNYEF